MSLGNIAGEMAQNLAIRQTKQDKIDKFTNRLKEIFNTSDVIFNKGIFFHYVEEVLRDSSFVIDGKIILIPNEFILEDDFDNFFLSIFSDYEEKLRSEGRLDEIKELLNDAQNKLDTNNITYIVNDIYM